MLQITQTAADHIGEARRDQGLSDDVGIRVSGAPTNDGQVALQIAFVEEPAAGDQVSEQHGTKLFVAADVAEPLSEVEIDVEPETPQGAQLVLREQSASD